MKKLVFLILFSSFAHAEAYDSCETVLNGSKPAFVSQFNLSKYYPFRWPGFSIQTLVPEDGVGRLLAVRLNLDSRILARSVGKFPDFFKQFDMHASDGLLIIPDAERLNQYTKNGVQFIDVPPYIRQRYSNGYFNRNFEKGFVPLASFAAYFEHDRLEEHLIGALLMPAWLYQKLKLYLKFEKAFSKSLIVKDRKLKDFMEYYFTEGRSDPGHLWDQYTARLGRKFVFLSRKDELSGRDIHSLKETLMTISKELSVETDSGMMVTALKYGIIKLHENNEVLEALKIAREQVSSSEITEEFALSESIRIFHEVTGRSTEDLEALWQSYKRTQKSTEQLKKQIPAYVQALGRVLLNL